MSASVGALRVFPFLPSVDFVCFAGFGDDFEVFSIVFSATFVPAATAFEVAFFAVDFAFAVDFFAAVFATAASNFLEIAALIPASANPFLPALLTPAGDFIPESYNFCAVAFPTPGSFIKFSRWSFLDLDTVSPVAPISTLIDEPFSDFPIFLKPKSILNNIMESGLSPTNSTLYAQVRKSGPTHGMDNESLLRGNSHPAVTSTIYLGDIALTLLKVMQGHSTPKVVESPKFDEQRWTITTISGDLNLKIESYPYWGFGLITSCYLNKITIDGPLAERSRLIFDLVASLPHNPWEFKRKGKFAKISDIKANEKEWRDHISYAKDDLTELIEFTLQEKGDSHEIEIAKNALADGNAPAVMRALARLEADSIDIEPEDVAPDGDILVIEEDVPFVDLAIEEE